MSRDYQQTTIVGNVGQDPDRRVAQNGQTVTRISVAVNSVWRDRSTGEQRKDTTWYPVAFFGKTGEIAAEYLEKGSRVMVVGRMRSYKFEQDGNKKTYWELAGNELIMLGTRGAETNAPEVIVEDDVVDPQEQDIPF